MSTPNQPSAGETACRDLIKAIILDRPLSSAQLALLGECSREIPKESKGNPDSYLSQKAKIAKLAAEKEALVNVLKEVWDFWAGGDVPPHLELKIRTTLELAKG